MKRTRASLEKMIASRRANRVKRLAEQASSIHEVMGRVKTATTYLMQAENKMSKPYSESELYSLLALRVLTTK